MMGTGEEEKDVAKASNMWHSLYKSLPESMGNFPCVHLWKGETIWRSTVLSPVQKKPSGNKGHGYDRIVQDAQRGLIHKMNLAKRKENNRVTYHSAWASSLCSLMIFANYFSLQCFHL